MRIFKLFFSIIVSTFLFFAVKAEELIIAFPGTYTLGYDLTLLAVAPDTIIRISASDVVLDLDNKVISQSNPLVQAGVSGITVDANLSNITIRNGIVGPVSDSGILVNTGCNRVTVENIVCTNCRLRGFNFSSVTTATIRNCKSVACGAGVTAAGNIDINRFINSFNIIIDDFQISDSVNTNVASIFSALIINANNSVINNVRIFNNNLTALRGFDIVAANGCEFSNCQVAGNIGTFARGFNIGLVTNSIFVGCGTSQNSSTGAASGFFCTISSGLSFKDCFAIGNSTTNIMRGFELATTSSSLFQSCVAINNSGASSASGFHLSAASNDDLFLDCEASSQLSSGGTSAGFQFATGSSYGFLVDCVAANNVSNTSSGSGVVFEIGSNATRWTVRNCTFSNNIGVSSALSFGVFVGTAQNNVTQSNLFIDNVAYFNGISQPTIVAANGFFNVAGGSVSIADCISLNGITFIHTNITSQT